MPVSKEIISYGRIENRLMHPHRNPGMEIVLVERGHLDWAVEQVPEVLNPGSVFFTLPWQVHGSLSVREPRNRICYILFSLTRLEGPHDESLGLPASLGFSAEEEMLLSSILVPARRHAWPATPLLKGLFPRLIRKLDSASAIDTVAARSLLRSLIVELAEIVGTVPISSGSMTGSMVKVQQLLSDLKISLDHPWTLEEMAESCAIRRTQLANLCRQLTGYPPVLYLNRVRFERACELLRTSGRPITDIAFECGYSSSQYFAETFKRFARMTPSEYRKHLPQLDTIMASNWSHPESRSIDDERRRAQLIK